MSGKYLIFGATGSIGSNLAKLMVGKNHDVQLIGRDENALNALSSELNCKYSVVDVLDEQSVKNLKNELEGQEIAGIAYCVGSIDLKPVRAVKKDDFIKCFDLNFFPIIETIKNFQDNLKKNKGSIVMFSTVAVQRGFTNHSIIASVKGAIEGLTVSLAAEFAPNIRVNCIAPSLTKSKIADPILSLIHI